MEVGDNAKSYLSVLKLSCTVLFFFDRKLCLYSFLLIMVYPILISIDVCKLNYFLHPVKKYSQYGKDTYTYFLKKDSANSLEELDNRRLLVG